MLSFPPETLTRSSPGAINISSSCLLGAVPEPMAGLMAHPFVESLEGSKPISLLVAAIEIPPLDNVTGTQANPPGRPIALTISMDRGGVPVTLGDGVGVAEAGTVPVNVRVGVPVGDGVSVV